MLLKNLLKMDNDNLNVLSVTGNIVLKSSYMFFEKDVNKLYDFLHIFKSDLQGIL